MQKHIFSLLALLLVAQFSLANVITGQAAIPTDYYSSVDNKHGADNILSALNDIIDGHTVIPYKELEPYYEQTDFYADTLWDMYSTCRFTMDDANVPQKAVCDGWNKEHVCCQSWLGGGPMVSDLFNVYPTDARVNNIRSNFPYGEVNGANGTGISKNTGNHAMGKKGSNTFSGYTGEVFEPHDDYKGDFARTFMYMVARYRDYILNEGYGSAMFVSGKTNFTDYAKNLLMKWHRADPVSQKEIDRNQAVYGIQHNRNPFIDYPELAEFIWGYRVGDTIDLATMVPTCEGGGDPVPAAMYGVTWSANGNVLYVDSIAEKVPVRVLPQTPVSCSSESDVFVGWTTEPIDGTTDEAPAVLYVQPADFPVVTADVTYYAVFAHAEKSAAVEPAVYTFDENHQTDWMVTAPLISGSYWLLETGKTIVSPVIDLMGLSSITVTMRTYGGAQYNKLDIYQADGKLVSIEATAGKTMTEYTWDNNLYLAGNSALTFSSDYGENKGIGIRSITINATGDGTTYSAYLTQCDATEIDRVYHTGSNRKLLIDGRLYIMVNDQIFTVTGKKVR